MSKRNSCEIYSRIEYGHQRLRHIFNSRKNKILNNKNSNKSLFIDSLFRYILKDKIQHLQLKTKDCIQVFGNKYNVTINFKKIYKETLNKCL